MNELELKALLQKGEDSLTEFKEKISSPDELVSEICALVNAQGGCIVLGVRDTGEITGVERDYSDEISNWSVSKIEPPLPVLIEKVVYEGKLVIVINVPLGTHKPYFVKTKDQLIAWVRAGSTKKKASLNELLRLFQDSRRIFADEMEVEGTNLEEMDLDYLDHFFHQHFGKTLEEELLESKISLEKLLENLSLFKNGHLTLAGLLFFGKNPQRFRPYLVIWAIRIRGVDITEGIFIDRKEIKGRLLSQIEQIVIFLKNHLRLKGRIEGFDRKEEYGIPMEALREAVVNAVAHRDYTIPSNIRLFIFDDRIEVISPGNLPNTVTIEKIKYGIHVERNPIIVSYLTKFKKMSQIGTGIPRMINLVKKSYWKRARF